MLKPDDRLTLLSALRPPPGYALDYAIATTYSLDLYALLAAPLAFTGFEWEAKTEGDAAADVQPLALLQALRRHASRLTIFCQAGAIHPPARHERLFTYLEDSIVQVKAPSDKGVFHPKVWALRYTFEGDVIYRLLVSSRNLTYDRSWDTLLVLEGIGGQRSQTVRNNARLGDFFRALPDLSVQSAPHAVAKRARQFAEELPYVKFEIPRPFSKLHFFPSGIPGGRPAPLPERVDRLLIISPFVSDKQLKSLVSTAQRDVTLVSRIDSLTSLSSETLGMFDKAYTLNEDANPEPQDVVEPVTQAATSQLSGLHAKLYIADSRFDTYVMTGSANATLAAAEDNVEFMVELTGKRSDCGVLAFLGDDAAKKNEGFLPLLVEYARDLHVQTSESAQIALERQAERIAIDLASAALRCQVSQSATDQDGLFELRLTGTVPALPDLATLRCWPVSLGEVRAQEIRAGVVDVAFRGVSLLSVTPLFVFEIAVSGYGESVVKQVLIKLPLDGAPANRAEAVLLDMLSDAGAFTRMLQLLMAGDEPLRLSTVFPKAAATAARAGNHAGPVSALFESLLRTFERAPERLDEIARMINDVQAAQKGEAVLPAGFASIWEPIWQARQRRATKRGVSSPAASDQTTAAMPEVGSETILDTLPGDAIVDSASDEQKLGGGAELAPAPDVSPADPELPRIDEPPQDPTSADGTSEVQP